MYSTLPILGELGLWVIMISQYSHINITNVLPWWEILMIRRLYKCERKEYMLNLCATLSMFL